MVNLMDLPREIRLEIYSYLFLHSKVILDAGNYSGPSYLIPQHAVPLCPVPHSAQLLRTCKAVLHEARPLLYDNTIFHVTNNTFAGSLPVGLSNGNPLSGHIRHIIWQLQCDLMKKFDFDDLNIQEDDLITFDDIEFRCSSVNWREPSCGEPHEPKSFTDGKMQMVAYFRCLQRKLSESGQDFAVVEDRKLLGKGEIRWRLTRSPHALTSTEIEVA